MNASNPLTLPDAIGRLHFVGCFLSSCLSNQSLITYTELEIREKEIKAINKLKEISALKRFEVKKAGRKIKKFLM